MKLHLTLLFVFLAGSADASQLEAQTPACSESGMCAIGIALNSASLNYVGGTIQPCGFEQNISAVSTIPAGSFTGGPGTEMTKMINRLGLGSDCASCKALAAEMDRGGPQWVRQNRNYVVLRTINNAKNLGHRMGPIQRAGVRTLVRKSIRRSRH